MNKIRLILVLFFLLSLGVNAVFADVPSVTSLEVADGTNDRILDITIRHSSPTNVHYVNEIEVKVGDDAKVFELEPQSSTVFSEQVNIAANGEVLVRAYCTFHGWSSWVSLEADSEPTDEPRDEIPGFSILALGIGLVLYASQRYK